MTWPTHKDRARKRRKAWMAAAKKRARVRRLLRSGKRGVTPSASSI